MGETLVNGPLSMKLLLNGLLAHQDADELVFKAKGQEIGKLSAIADMTGVLDWLLALAEKPKPSISNAGPNEEFKFYVG